MASINQNKNIPIVSVKNLKKSYGNHQVLNGVNFEVQKGSIFALLGGNGAGKTTTIRILSTLIMPDSGEANVGGYDVAREDAKVREVISLTGQFAAVDELLTGEENMIMMGRFSHVEPAIIRRRVPELLSQLDLTGAAQRPAQTYSGGMRRRLDLAISLLARPPIIFLDEPTTGLDPRSRQAIWKIIKDLVADGTTIFLTTQYLEEADQLADQIAVLSKGRIAAMGTAEDLKNQVGGELVELSYATDDAYMAAQHVVDGKVLHKDDGQKVLGVATDGTAADLRDLLNSLTTANAMPARLHLRKPTLDDVFMQITADKKGEKE